MKTAIVFVLIVGWNVGVVEMYAIANRSKSSIAYQLSLRTGHPRSFGRAFDVARLTSWACFLTLFAGAAWQVAVWVTR